jgi:HEAT repeat protein
VLLALLSDPSPIVRGFAAEALGAVGQPGDDAELKRRLAVETDPFVRAKLEGAIGSH